jgi:hypothetical protein
MRGGKWGGTAFVGLGGRVGWVRSSVMIKEDGPDSLNHVFMLDLAQQRSLQLGLLRST